MHSSTDSRTDSNHCCTYSHPPPSVLLYVVFYACPYKKNALYECLWNISLYIRHYIALHREYQIVCQQFQSIYILHNSYVQEQWMLIYISFQGNPGPPGLPGFKGELGPKGEKVSAVLTYEIQLANVVASTLRHTWERQAAPLHRRQSYQTDAAHSVGLTTSTESLSHIG